MTPHKRSGFTLTELLVVITIIGVLMGLLLPAIMAATGRARIAQCTNNQKELGSAILQYEMTKQRFPGYANSVGGTKVSWIPVLFPYLGRTDLWEGVPTAKPAINGWRSGNPVAEIRNARIAQLVCPDGSPDPTVTTQLSYVGNVGIDTTHGTGVFRDLFPAAKYVPIPITQSNIKSASRRPMISERNYILGSTTDATRSWSDTTVENVSASRLGFTWPNTDPSVYKTPVFIGSILPSIHRGIAIITFCDGHTDSVADNTDCSVYDGLPIQ